MTLEHDVTLRLLASALADALKRIGTLEQLHTSTSVSDPETDLETALVLIDVFYKQTLRHGSTDPNTIRTLTWLNNRRLHNAYRVAVAKGWLTRDHRTHQYTFTDEGRDIARERSLQYYKEQP